MSTGACPCGRTAGGRPLAYPGCCGRFIDHFETTPAPDAESLMRSRYTAFTLERADYLLATWHPSKRPSRVRFDAGTKWLGLEVKHAETFDAEHAGVSFIARQRDAGGRAHRLQESSRFVKDNGRWFYVDGDIGE